MRSEARKVFIFLRNLCGLRPFAVDIKAKITTCAVTFGVNGKTNYDADLPRVLMHLVHSVF